MKVEVKPGKYVVAVSGGVDSVVLLKVLSGRPEVELIVGHFDHGIRENSENDRTFVQSLADSYGLMFEYKREELGPEASEALARERRYRFLNEVKSKHQADAIITAHHKDDEIETACLNILRGTFRKGLHSLQRGEVLRPLLGYTKAEIITYAGRQKLEWREDETNKDPKYSRNLLRRQLADADPKDIQKLSRIVAENSERNREIDFLLNEIFVFGADNDGCDFKRQFFISLPYKVACELLAFWLRKNRIEFDRRNIELLVVGLKTGKDGIRLDVGKNTKFFISGDRISLQPVSSV